MIRHLAACSIGLALLAGCSTSDTTADTSSPTPSDSASVTGPITADLPAVSDTTVSTMTKATQAQASKACETLLGKAPDTWLYIARVDDPTLVWRGWTNDDPNDGVGITCNLTASDQSFRLTFQALTGSQHRTITPGIAGVTSTRNPKMHVIVHTNTDWDAADHDRVHDILEQSAKHLL